MGTQRLNCVHFREAPQEDTNSISETRQWLLTFYNGRNACSPSPESENGKYCGYWRKLGETDYKSSNFSISSAFVYLLF